MTSYGDEWTQSEKPAIDLFTDHLGYTFIPGPDLEPERESLADVILRPRLAEALKRINPWISDDNVTKAVRRFTHIEAHGLMEANETLYTDLVHYFDLEQDLGHGKKGQTVRAIDFENPANNDFLEDEHVTKIADAYHAFEDVEKFARVVDLEEIAENDHNLNIARYVDVAEEEEEIDVAAAIADLRKLERERVAVESRMSGYLRELGYDA